MSATFDPTLPTQRDHIRLALGDKHADASAGDITEPLLQDETIDAKLAAWGYSEALAQLADALATEYAQRPDSYQEYQGLTMRWSERVSAWRELAKLARSGKIGVPGQTAMKTGIAIASTTAQSQASDPRYSKFRSD